MRYLISAALLTMISVVSACDDRPQTSDQIQQQQQEGILAEGTSKVGMPAIHNFRERRLLKMLLEKRDQEDLLTFTYVWSDVLGKYTFFCNSVGYGIPYATQFTNPEKVTPFHYGQGGYGYYTLPQADPNGLFSPAAAEGTWVMCKDPKGTDPEPIYIEPRIIVSPFELPDAVPLVVPTTTIKK